MHYATHCMSNKPAWRSEIIDMILPKGGTVHQRTQNGYDTRKFGHSKSAFEEYIPQTIKSVKWGGGSTAPLHSAKPFNRHVLTRVQLCRLRVHFNLSLNSHSNIWKAWNAGRRAERAVQVSGHVLFIQCFHAITSPQMACCFWIAQP